VAEENRLPDGAQWAQRDAPVGGQAVLEGVMMRSPRFWTVAVRRPDGRITEVSRDTQSMAVRHRALRLPVIRGIVALVDSLAIGFRALGVSAQYSASDDEPGDDPTAIGRGTLIATFVLAIGFSIVLFKVTPSLLASLLDVERTWLFLVLEGCIRVAIFIGYLLLLSRMAELRRVFQYHAAEHKAINALEAGDELVPEVVQRHSRIHVRCGTAFLLWVMVVAIFVFAVVGRPGLVGLVASRILLVPLIAGLAYEVIRFAGRHGSNPLVRAILAPGLWLQRLTTREPTLDQIEVSIAALQAVLRLERERSEGRPAAVDVMA
jgi:uncharacterized protein YqhQ